MIPILKRKIYPLGSLIDGYKVIRLVGEGRFGICYLVDLDNKQYILKKIKPKAIKKAGNKICFEERILSSISHPSIPKIVDTIKNDNVYGYILEYKTGKTIEEMLFGDNHIFTPTEIYNVGIKIIGIIKYLHERNIVHRDIRVPNVIIDKGDVYLIDFGLARSVDSERYLHSVDFSHFGHLLIHLHYSSFTKKYIKSKPWYDELELAEKEIVFLKRLIGIQDRYENIIDIEYDFYQLFGPNCESRL